MINSRSEETIWPLPCSFLPERRERAGGAQLRALTLSWHTHTRIRTQSHSDTPTRGCSRTHTPSHTRTLTPKPAAHLGRRCTWLRRHLPLKGPDKALTHLSQLCLILSGPKVQGAGGVFPYNTCLAGRTERSLDSRGSNPYSKSGLPSVEHTGSSHLPLTPAWAPPLSAPALQSGGWVQWKGRGQELRGGSRALQAILTHTSQS